MKKLVPFFFSFFLLLSLTNLNAQCSSGSPCIPDCPADQFSSPYQTTDVIIASGCTLRVTYAWRIACGIWFDYYLAGVEIVSFQNCPFAASDVKTIVELAFAGLLEQNPAGFPPTSPGDCSTNWRAGKGACWEQAGDCIVPCTPLVCCLNSYTVCIDGSGNRVVTPTGVIGPPPGTCTGSCIDVCN